MNDPIALSLLKRKKIGFIGTGNLSQAIIAGLLDEAVIGQNQIFVANRSAGKLQKIKQKYPDIEICTTNEALIDQAEIIFVGMKPQDLQAALEPIAYAFDETKVVVSLAAGITLKDLKAIFPSTDNIARVMMNTAVRVKKSVTGYCAYKPDSWFEPSLLQLLSPLGLVVSAEEGEEFDSLTVACSSGTGFVLELMSYWQSWLEDRGFEEEIASKMAIDTFLGAASLAKEMESLSIEDLRNQVTSKKGVTLAGLEKMRELELEGSLAMSFEKAVQRNRQLSLG